MSARDVMPSSTFLSLFSTTTTTTTTNEREGRWHPAHRWETRRRRAHRKRKNSTPHSGGAFNVGDQHGSFRRLLGFCFIYFCFLKLTDLGLSSALNESIANSSNLEELNLVVAQLSSARNDLTDATAVLPAHDRQTYEQVTISLPIACEIMYCRLSPSTTPSSPHLSESEKRLRGARIAAQSTPAQICVHFSAKDSGP